jgi:hypothetical protein
MEPVSATILAALVAGAVAATKDVAAAAIKDAYNGFKALVVRKLGPKADVENAIQQVEAKPDSQARQDMLAEELDAAGAEQDGELVAQAKALLALLETHGTKPAVSYHAELHGSGAIAQGEGATAAGEGGLAVSGAVGGSIQTGSGTISGEPRDAD